MLILKRIFRSPVLLIMLFTVVVSLVFSTATYLLYSNISKITTIMQHEIKQSSSLIKQVYQDSVSSLLRLVESISVDPLLNLEPVSLNQILLKVKLNPAVKSAFFLDAEEKILADGSNADEIVLLGKNLPDEYRLDIDTNRRVGVIKEDFLIYSTPFEVQGEKIGRLQVVFSLDKIQKIETNLLEKAGGIAEEKQQRGFIIIVGTIIAIIAGMILIITITRRLIRALNSVISKLDESSASVALVSDKISTGSRFLAEGSAEQTDSFEQTSSSLEQIAAKTRQNADSALQADELVKNTDSVIHRANGSVVALDRSMTEINQASDEISKIIKTIDEIAFQTNLLALNAAVEAARAGQAGAGFAVVADEVRNLALRAAEAAKNTANLIEGTVQKIKDGSKMVTETSNAFEEVAASSVKVAEIMSMIAVASNEQAQEIEQVNGAMGEMKKLARQTATHAERSAGASGQLISESQQMKNFVRELITLVSGSVANGRHVEKPIESLMENSDGTVTLPARNLAGPKIQKANSEPFVR